MSKKLEDYSIEELIEQIKKLKKIKKFGLIWEDRVENVVLQCHQQLPVLKEVPDHAINQDANDKSPTHIIIEGDNYHSLSVLNYSHARMVDVIYIDPPYNRGGDFKYNDNYVDKEDTYRHSKWLSFMYRRLALAKKLLKPSGVCFISIDDAEYANLRVMCDELFGENKVDVMVWKKSGSGRDGKMKNTSTFRKDHEYILVCFNEVARLNKIKELPDFVGEYSNPDDDPRGPWLSGSISRADYASNPDHIYYYTVKSPTGKEITRQFELPKDEFEELNNDNRISWGAKGEAIPRLKIFLSEEREVTPYSVLLNKGTTTEGTKEATKIIGKDCTKMRPKPTALIQSLIQIALPSNRNGIVLDFFAGTGTTAQATLQYNKKYETNHQFILCTNNEENIASDYTYPRVKSVINGYSNTAGIPANVRYFITDFVDKEIAADQTKVSLLNNCLEMICLRENTFSTIHKTDDFSLLERSDHLTSIIFNPDAINECIEYLNLLGNDKPVNIYVFSYSNYNYDAEFDELNNRYTLCPVPESILEVYRRLFKEYVK